MNRLAQLVGMPETSLRRHAQAGLITLQPILIDGVKMYDVRWVDSIKRQIARRASTQKAQGAAEVGAIDATGEEESAIFKMLRDGREPCDIVIEYAIRSQVVEATHNRCSRPSSTACAPSS